jgi:hypothetical protein
MGSSVLIKFKSRSFLVEKLNFQTSGVQLVVA